MINDNDTMNIIKIIFEKLFFYNYYKLFFNFIIRVQNREFSVRIQKS